MAKIVQLTDAKLKELGLDKIYPITTTKAIFDKNNKKLQEVLDNLRNDINQASSENKDYILRSLINTILITSKPALFENKIFDGSFKDNSSFSSLLIIASEIVDLNKNVGTIYCFDYNGNLLGTITNPNYSGNRYKYALPEKTAYIIFSIANSDVSNLKIYSLISKLLIDDFYTKTLIDSKLLNISLDNYYTKLQADYTFLKSIPSEYVTEAELQGKEYIDNTTLESKGYITNDILLSKGYITATALIPYITTVQADSKYQLKGNYALKSDIPLPYNDLELRLNIEGNKLNINKIKTSSGLDEDFSFKPLPTSTIIKTSINIKLALEALDSAMLAISTGGGFNITDMVFDPVSKKLTINCVTGSGAKSVECIIGIEGGTNINVVEENPLTNAITVSKRILGNTIYISADANIDSNKDNLLAKQANKLLVLGNFEKIKHQNKSLKEYIDEITIAITDRFTKAEVISKIKEVTDRVTPLEDTVENHTTKINSIDGKLSNLLGIVNSNYSTLDLKITKEVENRTELYNGLNDEITTIKLTNTVLLGDIDNLKNNPIISILEKLEINDKLLQHTASITSLDSTTSGHTLTLTQHTLKLLKLEGLILPLKNIINNDDTLDIDSSGTNIIINNKFKTVTPTYVGLSKDTNGTFVDETKLQLKITEIEGNIPIYGENIVTTLVNLPIDKPIINATLSSASNISLSSLNMKVGLSIVIICNITGNFTLPIPVGGSFISMDGNSISLKNGDILEINILCYKLHKFSISLKTKA